MQTVQQWAQCMYNQKFIWLWFLPEQRWAARSLLPPLNPPGLAPRVSGGCVSGNQSNIKTFLTSQWEATSVNPTEPGWPLNAPSGFFGVTISSGLLPVQDLVAFPSLWKDMTCCNAAEWLFILTEITGDLVNCCSTFSNLLFFISRNVSYLRINWD